jgi:AcrR family transcriptional regulator
MTKSVQASATAPDLSEDRPLPPDSRAERSKNALREALLALLETKSFDQITIRGICAKARVHYATFFRHYPAKEALLDDVAADQIDRLVELTMPIKDKRGDLTALHALCSYVHEHRALWATLLNGGAGPAMRKEWLIQSRKVASTRQPMNDWLPVDLGTICSVSLIVETISWWLAQPRDAYSVDEIAHILGRLIEFATVRGD